MTMKRTGRLVLRVAFMLAVSAISAGAVDRTWGGGSGFSGNNWSRGQNWTGDTPPGSGDIAIFTNTQTANCTIDTNVNVGGFRIDSGYSGTITQSGSYTITIGTSHFVQNDGAFVGGASNITISSTGDFTLNTGSFTAPSATLTVGHNISILGGSFVNNNGTVAITDFGNTATATLNAPGVTFYDFDFRANGNRTSRMTNSCTVAHTLYNTTTPPTPSWGSGAVPLGAASITLLGGFLKTNSIYAFSIPLLLTNAGDQSIMSYGGSFASPLTISKPSGTVTIGGTAPVSAGAIMLSGGNLIESTTNYITRGAVVLTNAVSYTISGSTNIAYSGSFRVYPGASFSYTTSGFLDIVGGDGGPLLITNSTFSVLGGTLRTDELLNYGTLNMGTATFVIALGNTFRNGGTTFNNFSYVCRGNRTMTLLDDLTVNGDLVSSCGNPAWFGNWTPSGARKIRLGGGFLQTNCVSTFGNASLTLEMTGVGKTITLAAGSFNANLSITNSADVSLTRNFTMGGPARIYPGATLNLAGANFTATSLTVDGTLALQGGETLSPANPTLNAGSTVRYDGAASPVTVKVWNYRKLALNAPGRQLNWTAGQTYNVAEAFTGGGLPGQRALLRSTTPTSWWYLTLAGGAAQNVVSVDVQDSNAGGGQGIFPENSVSSGNNVNWHFAAGTVIYLR